MFGVSLVVTVHFLLLIQYFLIGSDNGITDSKTRCQNCIDYVSKDILHVDLSHIKAKAISEGYNSFNTTNELLISTAQICIS